MQVMCILDQWFIYFGGAAIPCDGPAYGEVCTVTGENGNYYLLDEWKAQKDGWAKSGFIPLTSETAFITDMIQAGIEEEKAFEKQRREREPATVKV